VTMRQASRGFALALALALPACAEASGCDGDGLHMVVEIPSTACFGDDISLMTWNANATIDDLRPPGTYRAVLTKADAIHATLSTDPTRVDVMWRWPAGATSGDVVTLLWSTAQSRIFLDGFGGGTIDTAGCQTFTVEAHCAETQDASLR
jgi:hypothetical protein